MEVTVTVSVGELLDKIVILEIKRERIKDPRKLANVTRELDVLISASSRNITITEEVAELVGELKRVNLRLWDIEDEIRDCERNKDFGEKFIDLARAVYHTNDRRAELKNRLNSITGSVIVEEKSYQEY